MDIARLRGLLIAATITPLVAAAPAAAETFTVTGTADTVGECAGTACTSIRAALRVAGESAGADTIVVPAGVYQLAEGRLDVDSEVTLAGAGIDRTVILGDRGSFGDRVFLVNGNAAATITQLTMAGGGGDGLDGGNLLNEGDVVLDRVRVTGGDGALGGGVANHGGTMTIRRSLIDANSASQGSGVANVLPSTRAERAAAPGELTVTDTTIAGNTAGYRGAVYTNGASSSTLLERVTITANSGGDGPAGIVNDPYFPGTLRIQGSIVADNTGYPEGGNCEGALTSLGGNVSDGGDCSLAGAGDAAMTEPRLPAEPAGGVYEPPADSPAVDRFACAGADQRGVARPQGALCDAGAAEFDVVPDTVVGADFTFSSTEPGVTFECSVANVSGFAPCTSPYVPGGLPPGSYTLLVRAVDPSGQRDPSPAARAFTIAAPPPPPAPTPTPVPEPQPEFDETVVVRPVAGTVRVRRPGSSRYVTLTRGEALPLGTIVDTKRGRIELTSIPGRGARPQTAVFYAGIFRITQSRRYTELRLTERLAPCSKAGASASQKRRPKTRRLWGDGKGRFRTRGRYSAATVRGTKWLVQDGCRYTRTRVTQGSVRVRDEVRERTVVVRKGKSYTARPRR